MPFNVAPLSFVGSSPTGRVGEDKLIYAVIFQHKTTEYACVQSVTYRINHWLLLDHCSISKKGEDFDLGGKLAASEDSAIQVPF
jgi:hypothetical protein